jgi:hypothetical protein
MVKNKIIFFILFCLSNANITHFRNNTQYKSPNTKHIKYIPPSFYEIHNLEKRKFILLIQDLKSISLLKFKRKQKKLFN